MKSANCTLILLLVFFGALNTLFLKFQNVQQFKSTDHNKKFFHPFIQALCMFLGEMLCGFAYWSSLRKKKQQQTYGLKRKQAPTLLLLIPTIFDLFATVLSYIALNMVASSVWQISRGGVIITTAIFSYLFLKKKLQRPAIVGCIIAFLGITGVQIITVVSADEESANSQILGVLLLLSSLVFNGAGLVMQKWIFNKYQLSPLRLVFWEGLYGFCIMLLLSGGAQFIKCPWDDVQSNCVYAKDQYYIQSFEVFFNQIADNMLVWIFGLCLIVSISISVPLAVTISKRINPLSRSLADVCRTLIIWASGIVITLTIGQNNSQYKIQDTDILVNILKGICFAILIFGTLIYHQMLPCFKEPIQQSLLLSDSDQGQKRQKLFKSSSIKSNKSSQALM